MIYGTEGTQALFTGLATQIVYGGCDHDTVDFYNKAAGTTTTAANAYPGKANLRQRLLPTANEAV
jgi:type IV secretory pathway TraG/TraD family ATPase VirD4